MAEAAALLGRHPLGDGDHQPVEVGGGHVPQHLDVPVDVLGEGPPGRRVGQHGRDDVVGDLAARVLQDDELLAGGADVVGHQRRPVPFGEQDQERTGRQRPDDRDVGKVSHCTPSLKALGGSW